MMMMPRSPMPAMVGSAFAAPALPLRSAHFDRFFGFDFLAEFLFFGVPAAALFAFLAFFG